MKLNGSQIVCESLIKEGVDIMFGLPGGAILPFYQVLSKYTQLKHILVRHEQGGAMAADGYARVTGKVGVCIATSGPGATNLVTGLATSFMDSVPIIAITGQVGRDALGKDAFQESDVTGITQPVTKHNYLVMSASELPAVIKEAFYLARSGRPGPVLIDIPKDVLNELAEFEYPESVDPSICEPATEITKDQIKRAAKLVNDSKKPVILSGHGVTLSRAFDEVQTLAEKSQIPVITTLLGISSFPSKHVLYGGMPGMHGAAYASLAIDEADLLIGIGMRFDDRVTGDIDAFAPNAKIIHIDVDPAEIDKNIKAEVPLIGDCKEVLNQLLPSISKNTHTDWIKRIDELKNKHPLRVPETKNLQQQFVIEQLSEATEGKAVIVTGVGQHQMWAAQFYKFAEHGLFLSSGGLGTMGYEIPAAEGAALGRPDKTVWTIAGDGGMQMTMFEFATIVENKLPVKIALMNNNYLGMVRQWQDLFYEKDYFATYYTRNPDFVKLAEAFGINAMRVTEKSEVMPALKEAMKIDGPVLIDFVVDREENVYPMIPPGQTIEELVEDPREVAKGT
jgi:acetolactate synthase-1/2/3 large subunit